MGLKKYLFSVVRNGVTIDEDDDGDELTFLEGTSLTDALRMVLGDGVDGYEKLMVNKVLMDKSEVASYRIRDNVKVEFVNKSEGGL